MGNALYKTQLCQNMMKNEYCPKGDDCIFAHSFEEQRSSGSFTPAFGVVQVFQLAFTFLESRRVLCFPLWKVIMFFTYLTAFWCWIGCYECYDMIFKFFFRFRVSLPNTRLPCANRCLRRACAWRDQSVTSPTRSQRNWLAEKRTQSSRPCSAKASRQPEAVQSKCRRLTLLGHG